MSKGRSPKVRKSESPEDNLESKVESPKSDGRNLNSEEEGTSAPDSYRDDAPPSEINKSDPDNYRDENPQSEIAEPLTTHNSPLTLTWKYTTIPM